MQYARFGSLPYHSTELRTHDTPEAGVHIIHIQGRALVKPDRRQLGAVSHQHQAAFYPTAYEIHQVCQQVACAEIRSGGTFPS